MPNSISLQNNFIGGLKTEYTGLNFPENACTNADNCVFSLIGDVLRREGIDFEANYVLNGINQAGKAINSFRWVNAGGDGETEVLVLQIGNTLYFFQTSAVTVASPLSAQKLSSTVNISTFLAAGNTSDPSLIECQFTAGNGYLLVYHPALDSFYCTYNAGTITPNIINLQVRDFTGIPEVGVAVNLRPSILTIEHEYNLANQGWVTGNPWSGLDYAGTNTAFGNTGSQPFTIGTGLTIPNGTIVSLSILQFGFPATVGNWTNSFFLGTGSVTSYNSGTGAIVVNVNYVDPVRAGGVYPLTQTTGDYACSISPFSAGYINEWNSAEGNYPSNSDVWFEFKDSTGAFNPLATEPNISIGVGQAPQGHFIYNVFNQDKTAASGILGLTPVTTKSRPKCGAWFQGRAFYAGVDSSQPATGDAPFYTWTENIYFSQIITDVSQFGYCYQINDPTDEDLHDELPSDGGVIVIQGCGSVYKLFPVQNGLLVFAQNGVWFITGSQGIGFTANDYTVTKIAEIQSISSTSFINVLGWPVFWNEEGIYRVSPSQQRGIEVEPLTVGTILSFYNEIPKDSKLYARGAYDPLSYVCNWVYRSTQESSITNRYQFDSTLNLRIVGPKGPENSFYPYSISSNSNSFVSGIFYISYPNSSSTPDPTLKYITTVGSNLTFSEERDDINWFDWYSFDNIGVDYLSTFTTGYQLHGKGFRKWQPIYVDMFSRNDVPTAYVIQGVWDFAINTASGKISSPQLVTNNSPNFGMIHKRHKVRGHGRALQLQINSVSGQPFDIMGWSQVEQLNTSV